jgi:hypothetical protein
MRDFDRRCLVGVGSNLGTVDDERLLRCNVVGSWLTALEPFSTNPEGAKRLRDWDAALAAYAERWGFKRVGASRTEL